MLRVMVRKLESMRRTSSAASSGTRSRFPSAYRYSVAMFCPSMWPRSRSASRIPSARAEPLAASTGDRYPIRGTFFGCCARAGKGRAKSIEQKARRVIFLCMAPYLQTWLSRIHHRLTSFSNFGCFDHAVGENISDWLKPNRRTGRCRSRVFFCRLKYLFSYSGFRSSVFCGSFANDETNLSFLRLRWFHKLADRVKDYLELSIVLLLQRFQFPRQLSIGGE